MLHKGGHSPVEGHEVRLARHLVLVLEWRTREAGREELQLHARLGALGRFAPRLFLALRLVEVGHVRARRDARSVVAETLVAPKRLLGDAILRLIKAAATTEAV